MQQQSRTNLQYKTCNISPMNICPTSHKMGVMGFQRFIFSSFNPPSSSRPSAALETLRIESSLNLRLGLFYWHIIRSWSNIHILYRYKHFPYCICIPGLEHHQQRLAKVTSGASSLVKLTTRTYPSMPVCQGANRANCHSSEKRPMMRTACNGKMIYFPWVGRGAPTCL